jgi:excisionase family DNA binding protein
VQKAVNRLLHDLAEGLPVHLLTSKHELSTQQAADLLGLSRTYVAQLIDQGTLPAFHVGTHRRLRANDIIATDRVHYKNVPAIEHLFEQAPG